MLMNDERLIQCVCVCEKESVCLCVVCIWIAVCILCLHNVHAPSVTVLSLALMLIASRQSNGVVPPERSGSSDFLQHQHSSLGHVCVMMGGLMKEAGKLSFPVSVCDRDTFASLHVCQRETDRINDSVQKVCVVILMFVCLCYYRQGKISFR